eukprot:166629-Chlamydomonas_euryale.AAC.3
MPGQNWLCVSCGAQHPEWHATSGMCRTPHIILCPSGRPTSSYVHPDAPHHPLSIRTPHIIPSGSKSSFSTHSSPSRAKQLPNAPRSSLHATSHASMSARRLACL